jgi:hypothetical protein
MVVLKVAHLTRSCNCVARCRETKYFGKGPGTTDNDEKFLADDNDEVDLEELGCDVNNCRTQCTG